ncbi:hypothetical protein BHM03_00019350 [Ensete ventricosum]|nr:hypothetical protein BHM03_00019350 [Ensete ventricosum]
MLTFVGTATLSLSSIVTSISTIDLNRSCKIEGSLRRIRCGMRTLVGRRYEGSRSGTPARSERSWTRCDLQETEIRTEVIALPGLFRSDQSRFLDLLGNVVRSSISDAGSEQNILALYYMIKLAYDTVTDLLVESRPCLFNGL